MRVTIKSRKLGREVTFVARDSGVVYRDPNAITWGHQVFNRDGSAAVVKTESDLRRIARRWIASQEAV